MSVMILDTDGAILGSYNIDTDLFPSAGTVHHDSIERLRGIYYMHEHPAIRVTALANYLDSVNGWTKHAGEFDQQEHFSEQPYLTLAKITVSGGRAADTGVHNWDVEMRDGACGACVAYDDQLQKEVLVFDGATTLHVYRNLTRRTPIVAKSQVSGAGEPWRSKYEVFNDKLTLSDGTECVARTWHTTATESVKRCMMRPDVTEYTSFMVSMRIRPDVAYTETSPGATTPRLFSDSLVGDANIRLFANGQLYLFVLKYGCRTKAYEGGFPVRAWTTITASIGGGYCRVYVNGTLHSYGIDARGSTRTHSDPYRSGQFFKGRMDSLQVFRYRMSKTEINSLHTGDKLVRDVPSKRYFAQTKTLDMNVENQRVGVKWTVAVMIPRDDIMRVVDANRRETLSDVQIQEDNTKKELTQRASATIMIIVAIGMTSVVVFLVFNNMMTRPFEETAAIMAEAAVLRIDTIPHGKSLITELGAMNAAMRLMLENLKLYKSFMPQSVQLEDSSDGASSSDCGATSVGSFSSKAKSRCDSSSVSVSVLQNRQLHCALSAKNFTFLVMNIRKWHSRIAGCADGETISLHASVIDCVLQCCGKNKGVCEIFSGDRFACSFNAAKVAGQHKLLSCLTAIDCRTALGVLNLSISSAAVSGEGRVGNIGNASMRRFSFLTPVITWGYALERYACARDARIVVDPVVHHDAELTLSVRLMDAVVFPKLTEKNINVYEVIAKKAASATDEWMYQLEEAAKNDPMKDWNECALKVVSGEFDATPEVEQMMRACTEAPTSQIVHAWRVRSFTPSSLLYH